MKPEMMAGAGLAETLEELRSELRRLGERVASLEAAAAINPSALPLAPVAALPSGVEIAAQPAGLDDELLLVISAAIAAFLGKKPHIRQIHLVGHAAWAQEGRVTIQASHRLSVPHH